MVNYYKDVLKFRGFKTLLNELAKLQYQDLKNLADQLASIDVSVDEVSAYSVATAIASLTD